MEQKKLEHTKPFCLEDAKAGAPYSCRNGAEATIVKWDGLAKIMRGGRPQRFPLVGFYGQGMPMAWAADGSYGSSEREDIDLVMTPLGHIDGKPVFVGDEFEELQPGEWVKGHALPSHASADKSRWAKCRWPAPAKQYPVTAMTGPELYEAIRRIGATHCSISGASLVDVANAALRHAVDNGYLMLPGVAMKDDDIIKALRRSMKKYDTVIPNDAVVLDAVKSLLVTEPEVDQLRADLTKERSHLIKAENLLESIGWRWDGVNSKWTRPAGRHFYGQIDRIYVEGSEKSVKAVQDLAERGAARDVAIAEAVRDACYHAATDAPNLPTFCNIMRRIHLTPIISKVKP